MTAAPDKLMGVGAEAIGDVADKKEYGPYKDLYFVLSHDGDGVAVDILPQIHPY